MHRFWNPLISPALDALQPRSVVQIGVGDSDFVGSLCAYVAGQDVACHIIAADVPVAVSDYVDQTRQATLHRTDNLGGVPAVDMASVVVRDGDPNWYSVLRDLRDVGDLAVRQGFFPTVFVHGVGWPYGRRDGYIDPSRVPEECRQVFTVGGLSPAADGPSDEVAYVHDMAHAIREGGPANGVMTAVEDFAAEWHGNDLEIVTVPVLHGMAIVYDPRTIAQADAFADLVAELRIPTGLHRLVQATEHDRLTRAVQTAALEREVAALQQRSLVSRGELHEAERRARRAQRELGQLRSSRAVKLALRVAHALAPLRQPYRMLRGVGRRVLSGTARRSRGIRRTGWRLAPPRRAPSAPAPRGGSAAPAIRTGDAAIVVCVHNAIDDVRACLESVVEHTNLVRNTLVIVDDGSDPATHDLLVDFAGAQPCVLLRNDTAQGYTRAANAGIRHVEADFVVLLNSDTIVTPGWLEGLVRVALERPDAAVVGPLSNAASWQSVPELTDSEGKWVVNPPPAGGIDAYAVRLAKGSSGLAPELPLINGFCYLITRRALDSVGLLDEERFPRGYGEEDDFSIRCRAAGFSLYLADDVYVFHAKSKSFTPDGRAAITPQSKQALWEKHGRKSLEASVEETRLSEDLVRARVTAALLVDERPPVVLTSDRRPRIGWLQPHLRAVGGIRRVIEMANRLHRWGFPISVITPDGTKPDWLPLAAPVIGTADAVGTMFDALVLSDPDMVEMFQALSTRHRVTYHLGPYMLYRDADERLDAYYRRSDEIVHVANSAWTADQVAAHSDVEIQGIFPGGVDKAMFHPVRTPTLYDVVAYGSERRHKGATLVAETTRGLRLHALAPLQVPQHELARHFCSGRIYVSGCWHEGFNFMPLEAMACGVPVVMTDDGGSREYAVDQENALVVPVEDVAAMEDAVARALGDRPLRTRLIEEGLRTAWRYDWDTVTAQFATFVNEL